MPDLKSELNKVITQWEQPETPMQTPTPTPNAPAKTRAVSHSEIVFNYVLANPRRTAPEVEAAIAVTDPQVDPHSVSSYLSDMAKRGILKKVDGAGRTNRGGGFVAVAAKYLTPSEQFGKGRGKRLHAGQLPLPMRLPNTLPAVVSAAPTMTRVSVRDIDVESLTIGEARALRDKLNSLFGA
jgi:hypothetical protein